MSNGRIVGVPLPGAHLPYLPLMRPGAGIGGAVEGWVLSEAIIGIATHYYQRRTIPCVKHLGRCEGCEDWRRKPQWDGYLAVTEKTTRDKVVFQLTKGAVDHWTAKPVSDLSLRGKKIRLQRRGESEQGAVIMSVTDDPFPGRLPQDPDVVASLARMWRMDVAALRRVLGLPQGGVE